MQDEFKVSSIFDVDGLSKYGYIYYPYACLDGQTQCKIHMYLHGCGVTVESAIGFLVGSFQTVLDGGWLEYSAANNLILIMPQAENDPLFNPFSCFDYTNYSTWWDKDAYATKNGHQPQALKNMLDRLTQPLDSNFNYDSRNILKYNDFERGVFDTIRFIEYIPAGLAEWVSIGFLVTAGLIWLIFGIFTYSLDERDAAIVTLFGEVRGNPR